MHKGSFVCLLLVICVSVHGISLGKLSSSTTHKLKHRLSHKSPSTPSSSPTVTPTNTALLSEKVSTTTTTTKEVPSIFPQATINVLQIAPTDVPKLLDAFSELEGRLDQLEDGRKDPGQIGNDYAAAQQHAVDIIHAAQEQVAQEQSQFANVMTEVGEDKVSKAATKSGHKAIHRLTKSTKSTKSHVAATHHAMHEHPHLKHATHAQVQAHAQAHAQTDEVRFQQVQTKTEAKIQAAAQSQVKTDAAAHTHNHAASAAAASVGDAVDPACCSDATDAVARAGVVSTKQSLTDLQGEMARLTQQLNDKTSVSASTTALAQENAVQNAIFGAEISTGTSSGSVGAGSSNSSDTAANCNGHININTASGDKDIWREEHDAQQKQLLDLWKQVAPQIKPTFVTDSKTLSDSQQLSDDIQSKHDDFKDTLTKDCADSTCALGASGGMLVEADTP